MMRTLAAGLVLLLAPLMAGNSFAHEGGCGRDFWGNCQGASWRRSVHYRHCAKDFWGRCADGRPRWRHGGRYRGSNEIGRGVVCHPRRRVVGNEEGSKDKARRAAEDAWMGAVRYDYGERFQNLNHARDVRHHCDPSSKTLYLNRVRFRCVIEATPCRATSETQEERIQQRYEEEGEDNGKS